MRHNLGSIDPYSPSTPCFECLTCSHHETTSDRLSACPECGGDVRNIAVSRE